MQAIPSIFSTNLSTKKFFVEINVSFTLRTTPDRSGKHIVYLLLNYKAQKKQINTEIKVDRKLWKNERVLPQHENARDINLILDNIAAKITKIKTFYRLSEKSLSIDKLVEEFQSETPDFDFISFFRHHLKNQNFKNNTLQAQKSILKKLEEYKPTLAFSDIDEDFFQKYTRYLRTKYKNNENTINSNLKTIKKYMGIADKRNIRFGMPVKDLKVKKFTRKTVYLFPDEVKQIKKYFLSEFIDPDHKMPTAYILAACYTGMRISDLQAFKKNLPQNITSFNQVKSDSFQFMKLNAEVRTLLDNYPEFFTEKLSDQKINKHLKKIAEKCRINKNLSMHVGRHTFATTYLRNGGSVVKLQKLLGHQDIKTTMVYVHLLEHEALDELDLVTY